MSHTLRTHPMDTKIPKFNGKSDGLEIDAFLIIFERLYSSLTEDQKLTKIVSFLEGDAANAYALEVLSNANIDWAEAKDKLLNRYAHSKVPPMMAASRRRLQRNEDIKQYFDDKSKLLRRTTLCESDIADMLTEGLPEVFRQHFYGKRFHTTSEWLQTAQDIEADRNRGQSRSQTTNHFSQQRQRFKTQTNNKSNKRSNNRLPPFACKYCRDKGLTEYHWHRDCPQRNQQITPSTDRSLVPVNDDSGNTSNYTTAVSFVNPFDGQIPVLIPAKIGSFELSAFLDTGSNVNIMPYSVAQDLKLYINRRQSQRIRMAQGFAKSHGTVTFGLTISNETHRIKALVLDGFQYTLLLSINACSLFRLLIDTTTREARAKTLQPQCLATTLKKHIPIRTHETRVETQTKQFIEPKERNTERTDDLQNQRLVNTFAQLFAKDSTDLSQIDIEKHRILLNDSEPVAQRPYRQSVSNEAETSRQIRELLAKGLIRESVSPYAAPITLADKKDGTKRLCIDYRRLNSKTVADKTPLPVIADVIDRLQGSKYFSKLDFASGYWQVAIHPEDIPKTAFVTRDGHYEWTVLPFGLKNSPSTFHRVVRKILGELINNGVMSYLDDIIVYASDKATHDRLLEDVFKRLSEHNARLKLEKCEFSKNSIEFLGHVINGTDVRPPPSKLKAITDYPTPVSQKDVQRFHGLINYLREYIPNFATLSEPITRLLKKNSQFLWTEEQQKSFNAFKELLVNKPVRHIYDPKLACELHTDASTIDIAGILIQDSHPIGYYSRKLSDAETRYTATELECLAIVDSIKYFRIYVEGTNFKVFTDHKALKWLLNFESTKRRLYRWSQELSLYTFDVIHRAGKHMAHVDALSRAPVCLYLNDEDIVTAQLQDISQSNSYRKPVHIITNTKANDVDIQTPERPFDTQTSDTNNKPFHIIRNGRKVTLLPPSMVRHALTEAHDNSGHPGIRKTQKQLQHLYFWPQMRSDIKSYVKSCHNCQINKTANHPTFVTLQPLPTPDLPLDLISMDTVVMGTSANNTKHKYLQVVLDHNSRYVWAKPTVNNTAETVIDFLQIIFKAVGIPKALLTDNGTNFRSKKLLKYLTDNRVKHLYTSAYHPQTNGANEKVNGTLVNGIRIALTTYPKRKWSTLVEQVVNNYNNTLHSITSYTPSYLMFGSDRFNTTIPSVSEARLDAKQKSDAFKQSKKQHYDTKHKPINLCVGDLVKRRIPSNHPDLKKLSQRYDAPFEVISLPSPVNAWIKRMDRTDETLVHVGQLEPYFLRDQSFAAGE